MAQTPREETERWLASLVRAFEAAPGRFVERLPKRSGRIEGLSGSCDWSTRTGRMPRLTCAYRIDRLDGLKRLDLVEIDPLSPTGGGPTRVPIAAMLAVAEGRARVYLKIDADLGRHAAALGGGRAPQPPVVRRGYRYAEARPGPTAEVHGDARLFGRALAVWVESVDGPAAGVRLEITPR